MNDFFTNLIINFIDILFNLFNFIFSGVINLIISIFPAFAEIYSFAITFVLYGLKFVKLILNLFCFPNGAISFLFTYYLAVFSIYLITRSIRFIYSILRKTIKLDSNKKDGNMSSGTNN